MQAASPAATLNLAGEPDAATARSAFLALVKQFHPHRFAREAPEVQDLANEIFLLIKAAYDQLLDDRAPPRRRRRGTTGPPPRPSRPVRPVRFRKSGRHEPAPLAPAAARARRISNHSDLIAALESEEEQRARKLREGIALIKRGSPGEAREMFRELAIGKPGEKRFRVYMHYAWGREHLESGRLEDAAAEFRRALKLDPAFDDAVEGLDEITRMTERDERQPGVFGRLFRRGPRNG